MSTSLAFNGTFATFTSALNGNSSGPKTVLPLESVKEAPSGTIFEGYLDGYGREEIKEFSLDPRLSSGDRTVRYIHTHTGFGPGLKNVMFRFEPMSGPVVLTIRTYLRPDAFDAAAHEAVRASLAGDEWSIAIDLPVEATARVP